ncbi:nuclease-related domain-containing protein [Bacillus sp. J14TS2]|uniref:nuclease-related domain-containing protein n=1 Tax=Bacillus sp. J14TS2 TaxID=2807188 RepID=UPI001BB2F627|nr:nuclease-related domain-containing protein [Bacillus sp. J14TS2]
MPNKQRTIPIVILQLEALARRLPSTHPQMKNIQDQLGRRKAGYRGEIILDKYTAHLPLSQKHFILQDLRLPLSHASFFQIDSLLVTPRFFLPFEAKHISGSLLFDRFQLIRTLDEKEDSFPDPILQVKNHQYFLKSLMKKYAVPILPSESFVVVTQSQAKILSNPQYPEVAQMVIRPPAILHKWRRVDKKFSKPILTTKELEDFSTLLIDLHRPEESDILALFNLSKKEIIQGIYCSECQQFSVKRIRRYWRCSLCEQRKTAEFIQALIDYRLLMETSITNREFRSFFQIQSRHMAAAMLKSLHLPTKGQYKDQQYLLDLNHLLNLKENNYGKST